MIKMVKIFLKQKLLKQYQFSRILLKTLILLTLIPNKSFEQLLEISPTDFIFQTYNSGLLYIEKNSKQLEKEDKTNFLTLVINL